MKRQIIMAGIAVLTAVLPPLAQKVHAQANVSFQVFYDDLSPYGDWVSYPDYGYVWVPGSEVGASFRPYASRGHWVFTDDGWTWVSDYRWGWATFHYGNWFYDDNYGWIWVPGYEWAPAWVTWGEYGGNYCWAPIGPRVDIGVTYSTYRPPVNYWTFCPRERITNVNVSNYYVRSARTATVVNNITVINNVQRGNGHAYLRGPEASHVERFTHTTVRPVAIHPVERPGSAAVQNGRLAIYRPTVQQNNGARPAKVHDLHTMRPMHNRPAQPAPQHPAQPRSNPSHPATQPRRPNTVQPVQPHPAQPHPKPQQPRPAPQQHPQQPHPVPQQHPRQPHPAPQQHPQQPHPAPQQHPPHPRPAPQHHPQQPHPLPRPVAPPHPTPPPHDHQR